METLEGQPAPLISGKRRWPVSQVGPRREAEGTRDPRDCTALGVSNVPVSIDGCRVPVKGDGETEVDNTEELEWNKGRKPWSIAIFMWEAKS